MPWVWDVWPCPSTIVDLRPVLLSNRSCDAVGAVSLLQLHLLFCTSGWDLRVNRVWSGSSELGV